MKKQLIKEEIRIQENHIHHISIWDMWGPYVSERCWGTVREDLSDDGNAWKYVTHDLARSYAYVWGEDGIGGFCDRYGMLNFTFAFWNHKDPILKERLFGLDPDEGNHGEDVKELYYYVDATPTSSYLCYLYKYPIEAFPYDELIEQNKQRSLDQSEFEITDTQVFEKGYFDIVIEYAKIDHENFVILLSVTNQSKKEATLDILPQMSFHATLSSGEDRSSLEKQAQGAILADDRGAKAFPMLDIDYKIGQRWIYADPSAELIFTDNVTNEERWSGKKNAAPYTKDAFHDYVIHQKDSIHREKGTKAAFYFQDVVFKPKETKVFPLRVSEMALDDPLANIEEFIAQLKKECDEFYASITPSEADDEAALIFRAALSGMIWSRQLYLFIVNRWLIQHAKKTIRNLHWKHLVSKHVICMPDKWEYPWFAAWDLAFHAIVLSLVDLDLAKDQLGLLMTEHFQHPSGQIPAYEWEYSDLNPPLQAWALLKLYFYEEKTKGFGDLLFVKKCFHKLLMNFSWWVNQEDKEGNNIFEGGFLGLDNIGVIDRSMPIEDGGILEQSDATGWMGMFCLNMMRLSLLLCRDDMSYETLAIKFFQHFIYISSSLRYNEEREVQNWNAEDGFFYDVVSHPDGKHEQIKIRSLVGLIPLLAVEWISEKELKMTPNFYHTLSWFRENKGKLTGHAIHDIEKEGSTHIFFSMASLDEMKKIYQKVYDPLEFRSEYGLRSLSKYHEHHPFVFRDHKIMYAPAESNTKIYGGNSNWRGPIWFPMNYLLIETMQHLYHLFGNQFQIPSGDRQVTLHEMAMYFREALVKIFRKDQGKRPVFHRYPLFHQEDSFKDLLLFFEYFHAETGEGLGASHQTGWTALVANIIQDIFKKG